MGPSWRCFVLHPPIPRAFGGPQKPSWLLSSPLTFPGHQQIKQQVQLSVGLEFGGSLVSLGQEAWRVPEVEGGVGLGLAGPWRLTHLQETAGVADLSPGAVPRAQRRRWGVCVGWLWGPSHGEPLVTLALAGCGARNAASLGTVPGGAGPWRSAGGEGMAAGAVTGHRHGLSCVCKGPGCGRGRVRSSVPGTGSVLSALQHADRRGQCGPGFKSWSC